MGKCLVVTIFLFVFYGSNGLVFAATYSNAKLGIEFDYPDNYEVVEGEFGDIFFGEAKAKWSYYGFLEEPDWRTKAEVFAVDMALSRCTADGHCSGTECREVVENRSFVNPHGVRGWELYLKEVSWQGDCPGDDEEDTGEEEIAITITEEIKGPVYAFDISYGRTIRVFFFYPTPASSFPLTGVQIDGLRAMAESFRISRR